MEKSKLENIGNTQLFYLLKSFISASNDSTPDMEDYNLSNNCDQAAQIMIFQHKSQMVKLKDRQLVSISLKFLKIGLSMLKKHIAIKWFLMPQT